jgi:hypothetical protein
MRDYKAAKRAKELPEGAEEPKPPPRFVVWDITPEKLADILARSPKGLLVKRDELSGWIGSMDKYSTGHGSAADRSFWLKAYDGGSYGMDRVSRGECYIENLSVSLIGGIQPARLVEIHGLMSDGLLQRFLPVMLKPSRLPKDEQSDEEMYIRLVHSLMFATPGRLIFNDAAIEIIQDLQRNLYDVEGVSTGLADGFQSFVGKLPGYAGRLALILHMAADPEHGHLHAINESTVLSVRRLIDFIIPHALEFYRTAESTTDGERLRKIASWMLTSGKPRIVISDLTTNIWDLRNLTVPEVNKRVSPLVAGGWLEPAEAGPECRAWKVNPDLARIFEERRQQENDRKARLKETMAKVLIARQHAGSEPRHGANGAGRA